MTTTLRERITARLDAQQAELITVQEAAVLVQRSRTTIRAAIQSGHLPASIRRNPCGTVRAVHLRRRDVISWSRALGPRRDVRFQKPASGALGSYLRGLREARGWSQRDLTVAAGVSASQRVSEWERGVKGPSTCWLVRRVATALECSDRERLRLYDLAAEYGHRVEVQE